MSSAYALIRLPSREVVPVPPGGIIGRLAYAAAPIHHPLVSEAHAMVSLRGRDLKLLTLRGAIEYNGQRPHELILEPGQEILLAPGVVIGVEDVILPEAVLALGGLGPKPLELTATVLSLVIHPKPQLIRGYAPKAPARIWLSGSQWLIQIGAHPPEEVQPGDRWTIDGALIWATAIPLGEAAVQSTHHRGQLHAPMTLNVYLEQTQIEVEGAPPITLIGRGARILAELVSFGEPTPWQLVAGEIWKKSEPQDLRGNWDKALKHLRNQLQKNKLRDDLVQTSGTGEVSINLFTGDKLTSHL